VRVIAARKGWIVGLGILVALLVAVRAVAPLAVQRYVNRVLDRAEGYDGRIGDVDLGLWRGAYQIEDVEIVKSDGKVPVPLFKSPLVDLSIEWRALFDGSLVGEIQLEQPELNIVIGPREEDQTGAEADWREVVRDLMPVKINRVAARNASIHFRSFRTDPPVDVFLRDVVLVVTNLTNSEDLSENLVAHAAFQGRPMSSGRVEGRLAIDPYADQPTFDLDLVLAGVALPQFNDLFRAYAQVDVQRGTLRLVAELEAKEGRFHGYVKPFFEDIDVITPEEVDDQGPLKSLWETLVGTAAEVFQDQDEERVATRIPIEGSVESPDIGFFATLGNVVRNAFLESFVPALEHSVGEEG
jgi:hypothetical protein